MPASHLGLTYSEIQGFRPLKLDLHLPDQIRPGSALVVYIHGGAFWAGDRAVVPPVLRTLDFFHRLPADGYAVASIDYRLSGEVLFPGQLHDVKAAIRWLRANGAEFGLSERVVAWGESAGAHLAAMAGVTSGRSEFEGVAGVGPMASAVQGVVDWYGPTDFLAMDRQAVPNSAIVHSAEGSPESRLIGATVADQPDLVAMANPCRQIGPNTPPFLVMHGTADRLVPFGQSELLVEALRDARVPVEFRPIEGADHVFEGWNDVESLYASVRAFLETI